MIVSINIDIWLHGVEVGSWMRMGGLVKEILFAHSYTFVIL